METSGRPSRGEGSSDDIGTAQAMKVTRGVSKTFPLYMSVKLHAGHGLLYWAGSELHS